MYQEIITSSPNGIIIGDSEGKIIYANPAVLNMFGFHPTSDILNKHISELPWEKECLTANPFRFDLLNAGQARTTVRTVLLADKTKRIVEMSSKLMSNGLYQAMLRDITEHKKAEEALKDSERMFSDMANNSSGVIYQFYARKDGTTGFYYVSPKCEELFGLSPDISSPDWQDIGHSLHPEDKEQFLQAVNQAIVEFKELNHESRMLTRKGLKWVQFLSTPQLRNDEIIFNGIMLDITARIELENQAILKESYLKAIIDNQPGRIWLKNTKGIYLSANQLFASSCEIKDSELMLGKSDFDFWPKELAQKYIDDDNIVLKTGKNLVIEEQTFNQGETQWFKTFKSPVFNAKKEIIGTTGYAHDITENKKAEFKLLAEKRLFETVVDNIPVMLFLKEATGLRFNLMNRTGEELLGYKKEQLLGKNDYDFFPKDQAEFFIQKDRDTLNSNKKINISEEPIQTKDKGIRILQTIKVPVLDDYGKPEYLLGFSRDITDQKIAEKEHENLQSQLTQSQKMESVGQLAGGIAHDFNNMLGVILGQTELALNKTNPTNPIYQSLLEINNAAERSAELTKQLLTFARKQTMSLKIIDLNETIMKMMSLLKSLIGENISLSWMPGENVGEIKIDPSQLDQILTNLCVNAKEAIKTTGEISIETTIACFDETFCKTNTDYMPGNYVQLTITDNGCGIDKKTISKIFEPFFTTKELGKGTGLGLSTVYGIVKQNHGFITVSSNPGEGTTFSIYIPKHTGEISKNSKKTKVIKHLTTICPKKTILVVEDEPMVREMTVEMLELQGHKVISAGSAEEAIKIAIAYPKIDILITDLIMPKMNGRDLSKKIFEIAPNIRCLFMSGYTADVITKHGILEKDIHFIEKPFNIETLNAKILEILEN